MKNILILISLLVFSLNLNAQQVRKIKSETFDDITVTLYKKSTKKYLVKIAFPSEFGRESIWCDSKSVLYKIMDLILRADTRKGFHEIIHFEETINGKRFREINIMIRHAKKSDYIGIGKLHSFKYGSNGVLRTNARSLYNYLDKLRRLL